MKCAPDHLCTLQNKSISAIDFEQHKKKIYAVVLNQQSGVIWIF